MNFVVNKETSIVVGLNRPATPFEIGIEVDEAFELSKQIQVPNGQVPKTDEDDNPLYKTNVQETEGENGEVIITFDETTDSEIVLEYEEHQETYTTSEPTGNMIPNLVWNGEYDEEGNKVMEAELRGTGEFDEEGNEIMEEVLVEEYVATELPPVTVKTPIKVEKLEPIMIDAFKNEEVHIKTHPSEFTLDEVLQAKYSMVLSKEIMADNLIADIFLDQNDLDLAWEEHKADTGMGILSLQPLGKAKTKLVTLAQTADTFKVVEAKLGKAIMKVNGVEPIDGVITLPAPVDAIVISFENPTEKPTQPTAYALGY